MLRFFKSNNVGIVIANLVMMVLFRIVLWVEPVHLTELYHHSEPAAMLLMRWCHIGSSIAMIWLVLSGGVLCFLESLLINGIINKHKVSPKKTFLGGFLFVVFTSLVPECMVLTPAMVSVLFLLLVIDRLFEMSKTDKMYGSVFDLGFLSGLAMLFYFPAVYLLVFVYVGFFTMRPATIKELLIIMTGFVAVVFSVFVLYFWFDTLPQMLADMVNLPNRKPLILTMFGHLQPYILLWVTFLASWLLANLPALIYSSVIQTRKFVTILTVGAVLSVLVSPLALDFDLSHLLFLFAAMSILFAVYFVETKSGLISEILFISLILSVLVFQYLPLFIKV